VFVNPALSVFQKPAGPFVIITCPYCIPGDIVYTVLVAKFGCGSRFDSSGIKCFYYGYVMVKQEHMAVEGPGTALCTGRTPKSYLPDYRGKAFYGILEKTVTFLDQCRYSQRDRSQGNWDHLSDLPETVMAHLMCFLRRGLNEVLPFESF
jgi:hypothetical protein